LKPPHGKTDTRFITDLLEGVANYIGNEGVNNVPYSALALSGANCNMWAASLIEFAGGKPHPNFVGRDFGRKDRINADYFKPGGVRRGVSRAWVPVQDVSTMPTFIW
jgi:hypothetical protein